MDVERIREDFPLTSKYVYLNTGFYGPMPVPVVEAMEEYLEECSLKGPATYDLLCDVLREKERVRGRIARLIGASPTEIAFTRCTMEAMNLVIKSIKWEKGDKVIINDKEYPSNMRIWKHLEKKYGIEVIIVKSRSDGVVDPADVEKAIDEKTKLISMCHASYIDGSIIPAEEIGKIAEEYNILYLLDGAQAVGYFPVDVKRIRCDFYAFCGHKALCGPQGVGLLYFNEKRADLLEPLVIGEPIVLGMETGNVIEDDEYLPPYSFETTTLNYIGIIGLGAALDYIEKEVGGVAEIRRYNMSLMEYAMESLGKIPGVKIEGPTDLERRNGFITFSSNIPAVLVVTALYSLRRVVVRPVKNMVRACLHFFNTEEDIDILCDALTQIQRLIKLHF
ncbi:MAG: aminotransferase class V-fold PLP-dependent enzyme [Candidatus Baldrarchaeia archaeon]